MSIIADAVAKQDIEEVKKRLEVLFVNLSVLTGNNVYVAMLDALDKTAHFDECRKYNGNAYISVLSGYVQEVRQYLDERDIKVVVSKCVPDEHQYYFVCKV